MVKGLFYTSALIALGSLFAGCSDTIPPNCRPEGKTKSEDCLTEQGEEGLRYRMCENKNWNDWSECEPFSCEPEGDIKNRECGDGGLQSRQCLDGEWTQWSDCLYSPECKDGETKLEPEQCGPNKRDTLELICQGEEWFVLDCHALDQCRLGNEQECYTGPEGTLDVGECSAGMQTCVDTSAENRLISVWGECESETLPTDEACDGLDNDCDGRYDFSNNVPVCLDEDQDGYCAAGIEIKPGHPSCANGGGDCNDDNADTYPGAPEQCNNQDDDCDELTDEDLTRRIEDNCGPNGNDDTIEECNAGQWQESYCDQIDECVLNATSDCYTGPDGTKDVGLCHGGTSTCSDDIEGIARWGSCEGEIIPVPEDESEKCNAKDDDCNGIIDDNFCEVSIPAGTFVMGNEDDSDATPRNVQLDSFFIHKYEVSNREYRVCVEEGPCGPGSSADSDEDDNLPVSNVDWYDAKNYCEWIGKKLPTEAEWERSARGDDDRAFPWGTFDKDCSRANYTRATAQGGACFGDKEAVDSHPAGVSPYGVFNLSGNVWEWVSDWYDPAYPRNRPNPDINPTGSETGTERVWRGGSYNSTIYPIRTFARNSEEPDIASLEAGLRCLRK